MITGFIITAATEAAIAITAPTERSTPPVAMTSVIPSASRHTVDPLRRMSIRVPYRLPSRVSSRNTRGTKIRSNSRMIASATSGKNSRLSVIFRMLILGLAIFMSHSRPSTA